MGFAGVSDVPSSLHGVLSGKAPHLPAAFTPGQHHLLDYGGCHLSSLSLTVKDSPVLLTKQREDWLWSRNSLQGWQAFFLSRKVTSKEEKEVGREGTTPKDLQQQLYTCTGSRNLHEERKVA